MPRTVDHIVATHDLARQHRAAGKPTWQHTLDIADIWQNDDLTLVELRDRIVTRIKTNRWYTTQDEGSDLHEAVDELGDITTPDDFDAVWDTIYDLADTDRCWIRLT